MHFASNSGPSECGQLVKRYVPKFGAFGRGGGRCAMQVPAWYSLFPTMRRERV
jgi:hypothetical protein